MLTSPKHQPKIAASDTPELCPKLQARRSGAAVLEAGSNPITVDVTWAPRLRNISHPRAKLFANAVAQQMDLSARLMLDALDAPEILAFNRDCVLLDVLGDGRFRYERYGANIANAFGKDMTGRFVGDFDRPVMQFFHAQYDEMLMRRQTLLSVHIPPPRVTVARWHRLMFPVFDETGRVAKILGTVIGEMNMSAHLEAFSDPAMLVHENGCVAMTNTAAAIRFGLLQDQAGPVHVSDHVGMTIDDAELSSLSEQAKTLPARVAVHNGMLERFTIQGHKVPVRASQMIFLRFVRQS